MSFTGDLEHLPIVDVIQLLHSTRKTGTLCLKSDKGESQLVFNDGFIVSANHVNNNIRIGRILVDNGAITKEVLDQALLQQQEAGPERKPLIAMLIEGAHLKREDAYVGLESLIEMTIVEVLTWTSGSFALDVHSSVISDEYRYFPETLKQEIYMNTQSILMDALRIFDEKMRDGTLETSLFATEQQMPAAAQPTAANQGQQMVEITEDLLGLDELEHIKKKIPDVFGGLKDYDKTEVHRQKIRESIPGLSQSQHEKLLAALMAFSETKGGECEQTATQHQPLAVLVLSRDNFIKHAIGTICKHENMFVFTTDDEINIDMIVDQSLSKGLVPLLVVDSPAVEETEKHLALLEQKSEKYPQLSILQLTLPSDMEFPLRSLQSGARKILHRPQLNDSREQAAEEAVTFLKSFHNYVAKSFYTPEQMMLNKFKECIHELDTLREAPDIAAVPLKLASVMFERCITLVVSQTELIAEKSIGVTSDKSAGLSTPLMFRLSLGEQSIFTKVIQSGGHYFGQCSDSRAMGQLFQKMPPPRNPKILLMPIKSFGRVIAITYGDFGAGAGSPVQLDLLDIVARHAGLVLDNCIYRKKFENPA